MYAFTVNFYQVHEAQSLTIEAADRYEAIAQAHAFLKSNTECTGFYLLGKVA